MHRTWRPLIPFYRCLSAGCTTLRSGVQRMSLNGKHAWRHTRRRTTNDGVAGGFTGARATVARKAGFPESSSPAFSAFPSLSLISGICALCYRRRWVGLSILCLPTTTSCHSHALLYLGLLPAIFSTGCLAALRFLHRAWLPRVLPPRLLFLPFTPLPVAARLPGARLRDAAPPRATPAPRAPSLLLSRRVSYGAILPFWFWRLVSPSCYGRWRADERGV